MIKSEKANKLSRIIAANLLLWPVSEMAHFIFTRLLGHDRIKVTQQHLHRELTYFIDAKANVLYYSLLILGLLFVIRELLKNKRTALRSFIGFVSLLLGVFLIQKYEMGLQAVYYYKSLSFTSVWFFVPAYILMALIKISKISP